MHVDRYEYDEKDKQHKQFLKHYKSLCKKYDITPIPKIVFYGIEDATAAIYRLDSGVELSWECSQCENNNESTLISYYINKDHFIHQEEKRKKERRDYLNSLNVDECKEKINELKNRIKEIQLKYESDITKEVGDSLRIISMRLQIDEIQNTLNDK